MSVEQVGQRGLLLGHCAKRFAGVGFTLMGYCPVVRACGLIVLCDSITQDRVGCLGVLVCNTTADKIKRCVESQ